MLPGTFTPLPASAPVRVNFVDSSSTETGGVSMTFAAMNLGTPHPDRVIVVTAYIRENDGGRHIQSATIGGVTATVHTSSWWTSDDAYIQIFSAVVPAGTTGDVVINMGGGMNGWSIGVFELIGADPTPYAVLNFGYGTGTTASVDIDVKAGGAVIALCGMKTTTGWTWSAPATEAYTERNTSSDSSGGYEEMIAADETGRTYEAVSLSSKGWQMHAVSFKPKGT